MKLLVVGRDGQVARALIRSGGDEVVAVGRPDLDLERPETFAPALSAHAPDVVACVGAYTAVDRAETEPDRAARINGVGPGLMAQACAQRGIPIVHVSTDYVFDGAKRDPYTEDDPVAPQSVYGATKADGELRVARANPQHAILRTAWVYDAEGKNFVRTMLRLAKSRARVGVVADQFGAPTFAPDIAEGLLQVARHLSEAPRPDRVGVFHMSAADFCSWADFATAIFEGAAARGGPSAIVDRITTADYPTPAKRPANSRLSCEKIAAAHGVRLPSWRVGLAACLDDIAAAGWAVD
ncbi:MAG: dTDP-4-dehydrorhamnose reductase [Hyphomonadaceae bacterium]|nr:dTDP-4-dehydrorhamnose reductase [Hyphomonadaceae bacterium]